MADWREAYRTPDTVRHGVWMTPEKAPPDVQFLVTEASDRNRAFELAYMALLQVDETGVVRNVASFLAAQRQAFVDVCIRDWKGIEKPFSRENLPWLADEYALLVKELFDRAVALQNTPGGAAGVEKK